MQLQQFRVKKRRNNFFLCVSLRQTGRILADIHKTIQRKKKRIYSHMVSESYNTNKLRQQKKMLRNRNSRKQRKEQQKNFLFYYLCLFSRGNLMPMHSQQEHTKKKSTCALHNTKKSIMN